MGLVKPNRKLWTPPKRSFERRKFLRSPVVKPWVWAPKIIPARCAVGFDTSGIASNDGSVSTLSNNFTIGSALSNGAIVGFLAVSVGTQITSPSMTWNAVSMGLIASTTIFDSGSGTIQLFGLVNPAGGTHSLSASWTTAGAAVIGFWSFSGVDQTGGATTFKNGNTKNNGGSTASTTMTVTTTNGNATVAGWGGGLVFSGTQTPVADWSHGTGAISEGQHVLSTTSSTTYTASITSADVIIGCGCDILAAAGGVVDTLGNPIFRVSRRAWGG